MIEDKGSKVTQAVIWDFKILYTSPEPEPPCRPFLLVALCLQCIWREAFFLWVKFVTGKAKKWSEISWILWCYKTTKNYRTTAFNCSHTTRPHSSPIEAEAIEAAAAKQAKHFAIPLTDSSRSSCISSMVSGSADFAKWNSPSTAWKWSCKSCRRSLKGFRTKASPLRYSKSKAKTATWTLISDSDASLRLRVDRTFKGQK